MLLNAEAFDLHSHGSAAARLVLASSASFKTDNSCSMTNTPLAAVSAAPIAVEAGAHSARPFRSAIVSESVFEQKPAAAAVPCLEHSSSMTTALATEYSSGIYNSNTASSAALPAEELDQKPAAAADHSPEHSGSITTALATEYRSGQYDSNPAWPASSAAAEVFEQKPAAAAAVLCPEHSKPDTTALATEYSSGQYDSNTASLSGLPAGRGTEVSCGAAGDSPAGPCDTASSMAVRQGALLQSSSSQRACGGKTS